MMKTIPQSFFRKTALQFKEGQAWKALTYAEFGEKINGLAAALIHAGV